MKLLVRMCNEFNAPSHTVFWIGTTEARKENSY